MGSTLSRMTARSPSAASASQRAAQQMGKLPPPPSPSLTQRDIGHKTVTLPTPMNVDTKPRTAPAPHGGEAWAVTLQRVSGVITSTGWRDDDTSLTSQPANMRAAARDAAKGLQHISRRSGQLSGRLPRRSLPTPRQPPHSSPASPTDASTGTAPATALVMGPIEDMDGVGNSDIGRNRLRHGDVVELFGLLREDALHWSVDDLCKRYDVSPGDMTDLLKYTRTYMGREDNDGMMRGYFNPDTDNTVVAFERL